MSTEAVDFDHNFLKHETIKLKLDTLTAEAQRAITLLKERWVALISTVVIGKSDVHSVMEAQLERGRAA
jgi:hypothetical protein